MGGNRNGAEQLRCPAPGRSERCLPDYRFETSRSSSFRSRFLVAEESRSPESIEELSERFELLPKRSLWFELGFEAL